MRIQILLIALLAWGPVGSALCEAACARSTAPAQVAAAQLPSAPVAGASHCHGGSRRAPASAAQDPEGSDSACGCSDYDRAAAITLPAPGQGSADLAAAAPVEIRGAQLVRSAALRVGPPGQPTTPYLFQNPPLLI